MVICLFIKKKQAIRFHWSLWLPCLNQFLVQPEKKGEVKNWHPNLLYIISLSVIFVTLIRRTRVPYRTYVFSHVCHIALEAWHRAHKLRQRLKHATQKLPCQSLFCSLNMRISMKLVTRLACRVITLFSLFPWMVTNIPFGYKEAFAFDYWTSPSACDTPISFYRSRRFNSTYYEYSSLKWLIAITVPEWIKKSLTELTPKFYKA